MTILVGAETTGATGRTATQEKGYLLKRTALHTGKVTSLSCVVLNTSKATKWRLGLFAAAAGKPSTLLAETGTITVTAETETTVSGSITETEVVEGTEYFIGLLPLDNGGKLKCTAKAGGFGWKSTLGITELNKGVYTSEEENFGEPAPVWASGTEASTGNPVTMIV